MTSLRFLTWLLSQVLDFTLLSGTLLDFSQVLDLTLLSGTSLDFSQVLDLSLVLDLTSLRYLT